MFENDTLETLFEHWKTILDTQPSEDERHALKQITLYTFNDPDFFQRGQDSGYFMRWRDQLPPYYQHKADVMLAILTRLKASRPQDWIVSEILEGIPQLAYFLFVRHLELYVLKDPLQLQKLGDHKPKWLQDLMQKGVTVDELNHLSKEIAFNTLSAILTVTDGHGAYGDLPENAPHPRIVEAAGHTRCLDSIHEYIEDTVLEQP